MSIRFQFANHHDSIELDMATFEKLAATAILIPPLVELQQEEIEVAFIDDAQISKVHADFLDDDSPTDVITFEHGEILISADTAARQCVEHGMSFEKECALYLIHGLLHLAGWDDKTPEEFEKMKTEQERILNLVWEDSDP
ncbi:MAG: rRNA maturation RNase YbeY [Verrucomicrobiota bacterium]